MTLEMPVIFDKQVQTLQNKSPKDATLREKILGLPFWAVGQEYVFTSFGVYDGVNLEYRIRRGGMGNWRRAPSSTQRATI